MVLKIIGRRDKELALNEVGNYVLSKRYLLKDDKGKVVETPDELFVRVAEAIASAEKLYNPSADTGYWGEKFYHLMSSLEFLPNSPALLNANANSGNLVSCVGLSVGDSVESVFETTKNMAILHKSGSGTGITLSRIRPEGDQVGGRDNIACGPLKCAEILSSVNNIKQGGVRQGCNSAVINVTHPDILKFIHAKDRTKSLSTFFISIAVTNEFMRAVINNQTYRLINPRTGSEVGLLNAQNVFQQIVKQAWKTGEPGITFIDRVNKDNPTPLLGQMECISGCGEQFLLPNESCPLGSINLSNMLGDDQKNIDYSKLSHATALAVRFLDNLIDVNKYSIPEIKSISLKTRKIGLGVMGFADMLIKLGVPYDSSEALEIGQDVISFINTEAHRASESLARERGAFPAFSYNKFQNNDLIPRRNATCTTIAPAGTISLIAGCSSGIEPLFAPVYVLRILGGTRLLSVNRNFENITRDLGIFNHQLLERLVIVNDINTIENIPEIIKRLFSTAHRIHFKHHLDMQLVFQNHVDNAISKTINLPGSTTEEDISILFKTAWLKGLKGVTIYRDGSRKHQPMGSNGWGKRLIRDYLMK